MGILQTGMSSPPPYVPALPADTNIEILPVTPLTCLLVGESRTGKSTFARLLANINYKTSLEVWRGTVNPTSETTLARINNKFLSITMLDMPGFGEMSTVAARSDHKLRSMITEFVKRDVCKISLVCIAIKGDGGLTASQVNHITASIQFLGEEAAARSCFLVTHFENRTEEDEKKFIEAFTSNPNMEFLNMAVQGGFLFTGAINETQHENVVIRDAFILQQRRRNLQFFDMLLAGDPIELRSEEMTQAKSMFAVQESVLTSCTSLQQLVPEVKATWAHAMDTRVKISAILAEGKLDPEKAARATSMVERLKKLGAADAAPAINDNVAKMLADYEKIGKEVRENYEKAMLLNDDYMALDTEAAQVLRIISWGKKNRMQPQTNSSQQPVAAVQIHTAAAVQPPVAAAVQPPVAAVQPPVAAVQPPVAAVQPPVAAAAVQPPPPAAKASPAAKSAKKT